MKTKRFVMLLTASVTALIACVVLLATFSLVQLASASSPALAPERIHLDEIPDPPGAQTISVTFPPGDAPHYVRQGILVHPEPPLANQPTELCAELINLNELKSYTVTVEFGVARSGIGMPFTPVGETDVAMSAHGPGIGCIVWIPEHDGPWAVQSRILWNGVEIERGQRDIDQDEPLAAGEPHARLFPVGNPFDHPVTVTLGLIPHLPDWKIELSQDILPNMAPGEIREVTLTVTPTDELPPDGTPVVDVEGHVEGELIGGFRKIFRPPVRLHRLADPPYAEREISVEPYPVRAGEPTEVCVELHNPTPSPQDVTVLFSWAGLGIGLPFTPINGPRAVTLPPHSLVRECIHWVPPHSGQTCLQVQMEMEGYAPQHSQLNLDVDEPLVPGRPHARLFPVGNPSDHPVTVTLGLIPHQPEWHIGLSPDVLPDMAPGEIREVNLTVTPPEDLPPDGTPIVDVEGYVEGELIGGLRKIYRPPVPVHRPRDPIYAESEIFIHPYPPRAREPAEVGVEIRNPTDKTQIVTLTLSAASFGIGLPFSPIHDPIILELPPHSLQHPAVMWLPPEGGLWCIQVEIESPGHDELFYSRLNLDVGEPLEPKVPHARTFPVGNPFDRAITVTFGLIPHLPDWGLELSQDVLPEMAPGEVREIVLTVTPPTDLPPEGAPIVDVEAYAEGILIGGFRKIFRPPVPVHRPRDPIYAESEIGVDPYPVVAGQPVELSVEVFNPTDQDRIVTATFSIAQFGIGLPFNSANIAPNPILIFVPAHGAARGHTIWQPHDWQGQFCVRVTLEMEGHDPLWSQRNIDIGEPLQPGVPHALEFPVGSWPYTRPVTVTLGRVIHRQGWSVSLSEETLPNVAQGHPVTVTLTVTPPPDAELGSGEPIVDVEAFVVGELIGGFRKLDRPLVPLHKPHEKGYAESEISMEPYPPQQGVPTRVSTVLQNTGDTSVTVDLEFGWARFGMGIPFTTTGMLPPSRSVTLSPQITRTTWVTWTPTVSGPQCVLVRLHDPGGQYPPQESRRNVDVVETPPCGKTNVFPFTVYNDSPFTATVDIGMITFNVPTDWNVSVTPSDTLELGPFSQDTVTVKVTIPCLSDVQAAQTRQQMRMLQAAAGSVPTIDVEGYSKGKLVGGIEIRFEEKVEQPAATYLPVIEKQ